jgi:hypothetical protein
VFDISVSDALGALSILLTNEALSGGSNEVPSVPAVTIANYTQGQVLTAFGSASQDIQDLVSLSIANTNSNLVSLLAETSLANGADSSAGDLEGNETYLCIKQSDLHDLTADEINDGRKLLWGIINKASDVYDQLTDAPDNFVVSRGLKSLVQNSQDMRQTFTIQATYTIGSVDLKAEA